MTPFRSFLPPGWHQFDLSRPGSIDEGIAVLARSARLSQQAALRDLLDQSLLPYFDQLRQEGVMSVALPFGAHELFPAHPTWTVSELRNPAAIAPLDLLVETARVTAGAEMLESPKLVIVRIPSQEPAEISESAQRAYESAYDTLGRQKSAAVALGAASSPPMLSTASEVSDRRSERP